jgi:hypothetical protein
MMTGNTDLLEKFGAVLSDIEHINKIISDELSDVVEFDDSGKRVDRLVALAKTNLAGLSEKSNILQSLFSYKSELAKLVFEQQRRYILYIIEKGLLPILEQHGLTGEEVIRPLLENMRDADDTRNS